MKQHSSHLQTRKSPPPSHVLRFVLTFMVAGLFINPLAHAADQNEEEVVILPKMEVTGTPMDEWEVRLNRLLPTSELRHDQFERQPDSGRLGDVISRMPGVFMGGPPGENKDIRLRGMDKEFTRFELDGLQLPGGGEKREFQVNRLPSFAIGKITILRNPTAEYESDGIAGRITADLRPVPHNLKIDYKLGIGGFDGIDAEQRSISTGIGKRVNQRFGFNLFLDYNRYPFEKAKIKNKFNADSSLKEIEIEDEDKPKDKYNVILDTVYFYKGGEVHFKPIWLFLDEDKDKTKLKTMPGKDPAQELEDEDKEQTTLGVTISNKHRWGDGSKLESDFSYISTEEDKDKTKRVSIGKAGVFTLDSTEVEDEEKEDKFWQVRSKLTHRMETGIQQTLKTGFHLRFRDRFRDKNKIKIKAKDGSTENKTEPKDKYSLEEDYFSAFIQDELFLTPKLSWGIGVRAEYVELETVSGIGVRRKATFTDINPSTHLLYQMSDHLSINAAVSRSLNRPKFDELAPFVAEKKDKFVEGNPDVEPATAINFDLGMTYARKKALLSINLFHKEIDDVIEEADTGIKKAATTGKDAGKLLPVNRIENVGDGWVRGIELEQRIDFSGSDKAYSGLSLWANESFLDSEVKVKNQPKRPFNDQPDFIANFGFGYDYVATGVSLDVVAKYRSEIDKFKADKDEKEKEKERWTLDLGVRKTLGQNMSLFFDALNLTDAKKKKTKINGKGERENEVESTGTLYIVGIKGHF